MARLVEYDIVTYGDVSVCYVDELVGGGQTYGQDYVTYLPRHVGKINRLFEWCSGPGFIGFSLLAHGLCDTLCLADVSEAAVEACRETVRRNRLEDRVDVYLSDGLQDVPMSESWDLVVGNPPHWGTDEELKLGPKLICNDPEWLVHRDFYSNVGRFLNPDANVIIQENSDRSSIEDFAPMIEKGGLRFVNTDQCPANSHIYYVWTVPEAPPRDNHGA
jgi:methylase of polypeptide subunit release factors